MKGCSPAYFREQLLQPTNQTYITSLNNFRQKEDQGSRTEKADSQENQRVTQDKPRKTSWTATEFPYGHYIIFGTRRNVINVVTWSCYLLLADSIVFAVLLRCTVVAVVMFCMIHGWLCFVNGWYDSLDLVCFWLVTFLPFLSITMS